jgi:Na+-driven multidrug efflux pump
MLANFLGVASSLFYLKMAGDVPSADQAASLATFQEARALQWLVVSGAIALQSLTTAKVRTPDDARAMLRFALIVSGSLTVLFVACVVVTPVRRFILVELLGEEIGNPVLEFAPPVLLLAAFMPLLQGMRFSLRGVLIARGLTKTITATTILTLLLLATALAFSWSFSKRNGSLTAYVWWIVAVLLEIVLLSRYALKARPKEPELPVPLKSPRESTGG